MANTDDGGPAFPQHASTGNLEDWRHGMSLRDYFAVKALVALIAREPLPGRGNTAVLSDDAYMYADAMLRAREAK